MTENATGGGGALINLGNLGDLSKPATVLIEKVSDAVGGIAKPWQIVRTARAEVAAETIRAQGRTQISEIEERALTRMVREEGKKQENIENITAKAIPNLSFDAKPENVENDWLSHFFDRCRLISDEQMQSLWANILGGQANKPGSFSKRTIDLVATFDKSDAEMFSKFCTYVWMIGGAIPVIEDLDKEVFKKAGVTFAMLTHLDNIGLITFHACPVDTQEHQIWWRFVGTLAQWMLAGFSPRHFGCCHEPVYSPSYVGATACPPIPSNDRNALNG